MQAARINTATHTARRDVCFFVSLSFPVGRRQPRAKPLAMPMLVCVCARERLFSSSASCAMAAARRKRTAEKVSE